MGSRRSVHDLALSLVITKQRYRCKYHQAQSKPPAGPPQAARPVLLARGSPENFGRQGEPTLCATAPQPNSRGVVRRGTARRISKTLDSYATLKEPHHGIQGVCIQG